MTIFSFHSGTYGRVPGLEFALIFSSFQCFDCNLACLVNLYFLINFGTCLCLMILLISELWANFHLRAFEYAIFSFCLLFKGTIDFEASAFQIHKFVSSLPDTIFTIHRVKNCIHLLHSFCIWSIAIFQLLKTIVNSSIFWLPNLYFIVILRRWHYDRVLKLIDFLEKILIDLFDKIYMRETYWLCS